MKLGIELDGRQATELLHGIVERIEDDDNLLRAMAPELVAYEAETFATQGHGVWAPLRPSTVRAKGSPRPLVHTGALLKDLTEERNVRMTGDTVSLVTSHPAARALAGGDRRRDVPPRHPSPAPAQRDVDGWAQRLLDNFLGED
ncbi:hypothetical protein ACOACO_17455 [Nocardioides sp. CPCC 205120]|uniref:hypothetical protein n=1 Tax=Nocardioides sp. CPCC 205120 TaxID=3406462 RepID=UPI003B512DEB